MSNRRPNDCCNVPANMLTASVPSQPDTVVEICKVCGCRHFAFYADPVVLGVAPAPVEGAQA